MEWLGLMMLLGSQEVPFHSAQGRAIGRGGVRCYGPSSLNPSADTRRRRRLYSHSANTIVVSRVCIFFLGVGRGFVYLFVLIIFIDFCSKIEISLESVS